ncbi:Zc3h12a-like Ribonuclease NYN domain-containing protein [Roseovarius litoreus]|uniref:Zc3h12a-like Ribonuclease NYN domain-containing protein n=2 Tax=Roseovarius litoreus TaxID=1155722 RepID=A0A1M6ZLP4_9RHOB|nr:Zc3h12a-like Ribonuclease NYN domain-containing protein [Roseovarius litoreus]
MPICIKGVSSFLRLEYALVMIVQWLLLSIGIVALVTAHVLPVMPGMAIVAEAWVIAALLLLLKAVLRRRARVVPVVVDGSNVMHWRDETPSAETLREVVDHLKQLGLSPDVVFDANAGYLLAGRYLRGDELGRMLGLPGTQVRVVPRGCPADPEILDMALDKRARVVSNDRFRDWAQDHPELTRPGHVIRGRYDGDKLVLDMHDSGLPSIAPRRDQRPETGLH